MNRAELEGGDVIYGTHSPLKCSGEPCPIHNRSKHHLRDFPQRYAGPLGIIRECEHGEMHSDPDEAVADYDCTQECDGCCRFEMPDLNDIEAVDQWLRA